MSEPNVSQATPSLTSKIAGQIEARNRGDRKNVFHGGTLCSCCLSAPKAPSHAYCGPCMAKYMRGWRRTQREKIASYKAELRRLRAIEGMK